MEPLQGIALGQQVIASKPKSLQVTGRIKVFGPNKSGKWPDPEINIGRDIG
jgi:hypothetical protein